MVRLQIPRPSVSFVLTTAILVEELCIFLGSCHSAGSLVDRRFDLRVFSRSFSLFFITHSFCTVLSFVALFTSLSSAYGRATPLLNLLGFNFIRLIGSFSFSPSSSDLSEPSLNIRSSSVSWASFNGLGGKAPAVRAG
jgi:hypothetical protein